MGRTVTWRDRLRDGITGLSALRSYDYDAAGPALARLDCNELAYGPTTEELDGFASAIRHLALQRYPEMSGRPLREALAKRWRVEPDEILLGNGSVEVLGLLMTAFGACRRGEPASVLYPEPSFPYYETVAQTQGVIPVSVALDRNFQLDEARLVEAFARVRPALALFASPNNPTGNRFDEAVLERLAWQLDGAFVVDEAYADFDGRTMLPLIRAVPGLFILRTLSKIGLAGLRLGALVGAADAIAELDKVRLPWNLSAVTAAVGCAALEHGELLDGRVRAVVELRREFEAALREIPDLLVYPSDANFLLVRVPNDSNKVFERLLTQNVLVKDVSRPGLLENCLRITVGLPVENVACAQALRRALRP